VSRDGGVTPFEALQAPTTSGEIQSELMFRNMTEFDVTAMLIPGTWLRFRRGGWVWAVGDLLSSVPATRRLNRGGLLFNTRSRPSMSRGTPTSIRFVKC